MFGQRLLFCCSKGGHGLRAYTSSVGCADTFPSKGKAADSCIPILCRKEDKKKASPRGEGPAVGGFDEV